jgi:glycerophosphoryl diester phosphodiesterase
MKSAAQLVLYLAIFVSLISAASADAKSLPQLNGTPPLIIGHRGACGYRPEHSRSSYELAILLGADFIEPDLVPTKDGELVARHENEIGRSTDVAEKFPERKTKKTIDGDEIEGWFTEDFTLAELKTLRVKASTDFPFRSQAWNGIDQILTLQEVIDIARVKGKQAGRVIGVYPETKHPTYFRSIGLPLEDRLIAILAKNGLNKIASPVFIQSFELSSLRLMRPKTQARMMFLLDAPQIRPFDHVASGDPRAYGDLLKPAGLREIAKTAQAIGPWKRLIIGETDGALTQPTHLVADAHQAGLAVHIYTMRDEPKYLNAVYRNDPIPEYLDFFRLGVDAVFSDFADSAGRARRAFLREYKSTGQSE